MNWVIHTNVVADPGGLIDWVEEMPTRPVPVLPAELAVERQGQRLRAKG